MKINVLRRLVNISVLGKEFVCLGEGRYGRGIVQGGYIMVVWVAEDMVVGDKYFEKAGKCLLLC